MHRPPTTEDGRDWIGFRFRAGDIVISTPRKSGTTWTQMICALLIFQTPDLPAPLWQLSPWLDSPDVPPGHVDAQLAAQRHRRFIKTHTRLAAIACDARVTYVVTARHPVDAFVSMYHQERLLGPPPPAGPPGPPGGGGSPGHTGPSWPPGRPPPPRRPPPTAHGFPPGGPPPGAPSPPVRPDVSPEQLHEALLGWIDGADGSPGGPASLAATMRHLSEAWARRDEPNVVLVHYDDLLSDLERQMRRLADRLGIAVPQQSWPTLVEAATFQRMRDRDDLLVPPPPGVAADSALFFRRGTSGAAREILTDDEIAWYDTRVAALGPPELLSWLHRPPSQP
jgi:aryl sulfotransferase